MSSQKLGHRIVRGGGAGVVGIYLVLDSVIGPVFRPLSQMLVRSPPIVWMERGVAKLPPYGALVALAVPFLIAEPAKIFGLYLIGESHAVAGVIVIAAAYLVSLIVVDRIYEAGHPQLMTIEWFAKLMTWLVDIRDRLKSAITSSAIWQRASALLHRLGGGTQKA